MLESKRINAYGKRASRIVYISSERTSHDSPFASRILRENDIIHSPPSTRKISIKPRKVGGLNSSPLGSPKSGNRLRRVALKNIQDAMTPQRRPLVPKLENGMNSASPAFPGTVKQKQPRLFNDSEGVKKNRKPSVRVLDNENEDAEVVRPSRKRSQKRLIVVTDDEGGEEETENRNPVLKRTVRGAQDYPIIVSDDTSDEDVEEIPMPETRPRGVSKSSPLSQLSSNLPAIRPPSPRRSQRNAAFLSKTEDHRKLVTAQTEQPIAHRSKPKVIPEIPVVAQRTDNLQFLKPLLAECGQNEPFHFSTFIDTFWTDDIHGYKASTNLEFRKIGEASYSEVFAVGDVVLKIVPLRNQCVPETATDSEADMPQESDAKDVLQEVTVTRAMGNMCKGFIKLLKTYVVTGSYPSLLLSLWDRFYHEKGSESIRPDIFPSTQAYAVLALPNGGPDLETYTFPVKNGWRQACSIFWQTAKSLAIAEELVSFEHRDLHWGQILVGCTSSTTGGKRGTSGRRTSQSGPVYMDDPSHGVTATIIDLGLARMNASDGKQNDVYWTAFDEFIFEGEGDYQFDIYRMMQRLHGNTWEQYRPLTNVMWLHYLSVKLLHSKLRPPSKRNNVPVEKKFSEKECYECLVDMEKRLLSCISQNKSKKGRGVDIQRAFSNAEDVIEYARRRGWLC